MNQHAVKFRSYAKLRGRMSEYGYTNKALAEAIGMKASCFGNKLVCRSSWTLAETYAILEKLDIPISEIATYFPPKEVQSS